MRQHNSFSDLSDVLTTMCSEIQMLTVCENMTVNAQKKRIVS